MRLELERPPERAAPEVEVAQPETGDVVAAAVERTEVAHVTTHADVGIEEAHHAGADVESEVVLGVCVEKLARVLDIRPNQADSAEHVRTPGPAGPPTH